MRLKLRIPVEAMKAGAEAVSALASAAITAFERALAHEDFGVLRADADP